MNNKYFSPAEAEQFTFLRIPKSLMTQPEYSHISLESKFLYGLLLDRMGLSEKNGWRDVAADGNAHVYVYFPINSAAEALSCCRGKAIRLFRELESSGLIERGHQGGIHPDKIFVLDFIHSPQTAEAVQSDIQTGSGYSLEPLQVPRADRMQAEKETACSPNCVPALVLKVDPNNINFNNNKFIYTYPSLSRAGMTEEIKEQLEYDIFVERYPTRQKRLDEIVSLMVDVICSVTPSVRVNSEEVPKEYVKERFLLLNFEHIEYIFDRMDESPSDIRNIRAYLLTALYNAPMTLDSYYAALVARDGAAL